VFHRFFSRATWSLIALGRVVFRLALVWIPADQPLYVPIDDTLARKTGKGISLATMHHDPLLSSARKPFCSFGHVWVVLALWVPLPMGGTRSFALPVLFRLYVGAKRGGSKDAPGRPRRGTRQQAAERAHAAHPRPTKLALARELLALVAGWADGRTVYAVVDSDYAARLQQGHAPDWLVRPWYRSKMVPSFLDMLSAVRQESWRLHFSDPPSPTPVAQNPSPLGDQAPQVAA
jgi:hypothetical protein